MEKTKRGIGSFGIGRLRTADFKSGKDGAEAKSGGKSKWAEYAALATVPLVLVLGNSMLVPILPDMEKKMNISSFQASLVITLFSVTAGIFIPILGYLSDRYTRKKVILPSLAVYGAAGIVSALGAIWGSYATLIAGRSLQGLAAAGTSPIAMALIGDKYKNGEESEALGLIEASNGAGKVISPILGSLLALIVWYAPFFAFPVFCAASLVAVWTLISEPKADNRQKIGVKTYVSDIKDIFRQKGRWLLPCFFVGSLGLFILFGVLFHLSDILEKPPYNIDGIAKGGVLAIPLLGLVITAYTTGRVLKNNGKLMRRLMIIGLVLMAASLAAAIFSYKLIVLLIGLLTLSSIGTGMMLPCLNTLITGAVDRSHRGMITSLYSSLRFFGVAFGPPIFTWLAGLSVAVLFGSVAALSLLGLGLVCWLIRPPAKTSG